MVAHSHSDQLSVTENAASRQKRLHEFAKYCCMYAGKLQGKGFCNDVEDGSLKLQTLRQKPWDSSKTKHYMRQTPCFVLGERLFQDSCSKLVFCLIDIASCTVRPWR